MAQSLTPLPNTPLIRDDPRADFMWRTALEQILTRVYASSQIAHNSLDGIQGGAAGQYYHLTSTQLASITSLSHNSLAGLQGGAPGQYYHLTSSQQAAVTSFFSGGLGVSSVLYTNATGTVSTESGFRYSETLKRLSISTLAASVGLVSTINATSISTGTLQVNTNANPDANDGAGLGTGALGWSDLFLASSGVINWANGNAILAHDTGQLSISAATKLIINTSTSVSFGGTAGLLQQSGTDAASATFGNSRFSNDTVGPVIGLAKSRATTVGSFTVIQAGDSMGTLDWSGADGADFSFTAARIQAVVTGSPTTDSIPSELRLFTTGTAGGVALREAMRLDDSSRCFHYTGAATRIGAQTFGSGPRQVQMFSGNTEGGLSAATYSVTASEYPQIEFAKSRNNTQGSNSIVQNTNPLGAITAYGANGTTYTPAGQYRIEVDGTPSSVPWMPGRHVWATTPVSSATLTDRLFLLNDGRLYGTALHNNTGAVTGTANQYIASGTYTPTASSIANVSSTITTFVSQWMRVGNVVTVTGRVQVDPTTVSTATRFGLTIPIASNFAAASDCCGNAGCSSVAGISPAILAETVNDQAQIAWMPNDVTLVNLYYNFQYTVL